MHTCSKSILITLSTPHKYLLGAKKKHLRLLLKETNTNLLSHETQFITQENNQDRGNVGTLQAAIVEINGTTLDTKGAIAHDVDQEITKKVHVGDIETGTSITKSGLLLASALINSTTVDTIAIGVVA